MCIFMYVYVDGHAYGFAVLFKAPRPIIAGASSETQSVPQYKSYVIYICMCRILGDWEKDKLFVCLPNVLIT